MEVFFLNVGYGESIVIKNDDFCMVVDGGSNKEYIYKNSSAVRLRDFLKKIAVKKIDLVVVTHMHDDHIGGISEIIDEFIIQEVWFNLIPNKMDINDLKEKKAILYNSSVKTLYFEGIDTLYSIYSRLIEKKIKIKEITRDIGTMKYGGLDITPLGMDNNQLIKSKLDFKNMMENKDSTDFLKEYLRNDAACNDTSLALHISNGKRAVLLTADKANGWDEISKEYNIKSDILKLTHHGQIDGMPESMLKYSDPNVILIFADGYRTYNSADPKIIERTENFLASKGKEDNLFITGSLKTKNGDSGSVLVVNLDENNTSIDISGRV